jgi:hypothetical protein
MAFSTLAQIILSLIILHCNLFSQWMGTEPQKETHGRKNTIPNIGKDGLHRYAYPIFVKSTSSDPITAPYDGGRIVIIVIACANSM